MNLLLFEDSELKGSRLHLDDRRADHILDILDLKPGDSLRVGMVNGKTGRGEVAGVQGRSVVLDIDLTLQPPDVPAFELVLALPRPIMLQRILKQATVLGIRHFHLVRSQRVQKSFFQSSLLREDKLKAVLMQGMEQAMITRMPGVTIHRQFKPFIEDMADTLPPMSRFIAHPEAVKSLADLYLPEHFHGGFVLAVGPEGGWTAYEIERFMEHGFQSFSMGTRILHVDTAVLVLLAQMLLLRELSAPPTDQSRS